MMNKDEQGDQFRYLSVKGDGRGETDLDEGSSDDEEVERVESRTLAC